MATDSTDTKSVHYQLWYYNPSLVAGVITTIVFGILTLLHCFRLFKARTWFCIPFIVGTLFETVGYAARADAHNNTETNAPYILQYLLILIAPALFAASVYMILGRLIRAAHAEHHSLIRVNWLTKIFVSGDVICFLIQCLGGGLIATAETDAQLKNFEDIILAGLILQIVVFGFFVCIASIFHRRLRRQPTDQSLSPALPMDRYLLMLYVISGLITVRNLIRVIEYAMGNTGYLLRHEWTLYVFDALLMAVTMAISLMWYFQIIPRKPASYDGLPLSEHVHRVDDRSLATATSHVSIPVTAQK